MEGPEPQERTTLPTGELAMLSTTPPLVGCSVTEVSDLTVSLKGIEVGAQWCPCAVVDTSNTFLLLLVMMTFFGGMTSKLSLYTKNKGSAVREKLHELCGWTFWVQGGVSPKTAFLGRSETLLGFFSSNG